MVVRFWEQGVLCVNRSEWENRRERCGSNSELENGEAGFVARAAVDKRPFWEPVGRGLPDIGCLCVAGFEVQNLAS